MFGFSHNVCHLGKWSRPRSALFFLPFLVFLACSPIESLVRRHAGFTGQAKPPQAAGSRPPMRGTIVQIANWTQWFAGSRTAVLFGIALCAVSGCKTVEVIEPPPQPAVADVVEEVVEV